MNLLRALVLRKLATIEISVVVMLMRSLMSFSCKQRASKSFISVSFRVKLTNS